MGNCTKPAHQLTEQEISQPRSHLSLKASTWQRDSHELFDYESPNLRRKTIEINQPISLIRDARNPDDEVQEVLAADVIKQNKKVLYSGFTSIPQSLELQSSQRFIEPILHVNVTKGGFFSVFDKVHFLDARSFKPIVLSSDVQPKGKLKNQINRAMLQNSDETEDLNRLWLIIRYMKGCNSADQQTINRFTLRGGERIKVGRVIFTVKELVNSQVKYYGQRMPMAHLNSSNTLSSSSESLSDTPNLLSNTDDGLCELKHLASDNDTPTLRKKLCRKPKSEGDQDQSLFPIEDEEGKRHTPYLSQLMRRRRDQVNSDAQMERNQVLLNNQQIVSNASSISEFDIDDEPETNLRQFDNQPVTGNLLLNFDNKRPYPRNRANLKTMVPDQLDYPVEFEPCNSEGKQSQSSQPQCRFCFGEDDTQANPLLSPCKCLGSVHVIHFFCLKTWLARKEIVKITTDDQVITYSWKAFHCELCKAKYADNIPNPQIKGEWISLFEISKPETNYMILESFLCDGQVVTGQPIQSWQKNLHVVNFANDMKNYVRIGRGNDNDLRLNDISVSRIHAYIKKDPKDGSFYIEDNQSKFGTLVQIQRPIQLSDKLTYYFQAGRTIFKAQVEKEQGFWERLLTSKETQRLAEQSVEALDPNGPHNVQLTGDVVLDRIGKFCGQQVIGESNEKHLKFVKQLNFVDV